MTYATVAIFVSDINDNAPVFHQTTYSANVAEDSLVASSIITVVASDPDDKDNAALVYSILDGNTAGAFGIDSATGEVGVAGALDRETLAEYRLVVSVTDKGTPPRSANVTVVITITDVNDNAPVFDPVPPAVIHVSEAGVSRGSTVYRFAATDADLAGSAATVVVFAIEDTIPTDGAGDFAVDPSSGALMVARLLDRERTPWYNLTVAARSESGGVLLQQTVVVTVTIDDINDSPPVFPNRTLALAAVAEHTAAGTELVKLAAADADEGANAVIVYTVLSATPASHAAALAVDANSGALTVADATLLDYEAAPTLTLVVQARNLLPPAPSAAPSGTEVFADNVTVTVRLRDINDHRHAFCCPSNITVGVLESVANGTRVADVSQLLSDGDSGAAIYYDLGASPPPLVAAWFAIDRLTGVITTRAPLDRETQVGRPRCNLLMTAHADVILFCLIRGGSLRLSNHWHCSMSHVECCVHEAFDWFVAAWLGCGWLAKCSSPSEAPPLFPPICWPGISLPRMHCR